MSNDYAFAEQFAPVYPALARQILEATGVRRGRCLDLGAGAGHQGLALVQQSSLEVWLLDIDPTGLDLAKERIAALGLENRARTVLGDACALPPLRVDFDLVVSRGSMDFWDRPERGLREAWRVLAPGGWAWIGGGFATVEQRMALNRLRGETDGTTPETLRNPRWEASVRQYRDAAEASGIDPFRFIDDGAGIWIVFEKRGVAP